jgi:hypothetical protein
MRHLLVFLSAVITSVLTYAQEWKSYDPSNSPIENVAEIEDITGDAINNDIWIAAGMHIYKRTKDGTWATYKVGETAGLSESGCAGARNGKVWTGPRFEQLSDFTDKLSYFNGATWQTITVPGAQLSYVTDIEISESHVWIAHSKGLLQYDGTTWTSLNYQNKFNQVTSLSWDPSAQKLWVGVNCAPNGNVFKYDINQNSWTEYGLGIYKCVHAVQALPNGTDAYVGSANLSGLTAVKSEQVSPTVQSGFITLDGAALNPLNTNEVWFISDFGAFEGQQGIPQGLILYNGSTITQSLNFENSGMKGRSVSAIAVQQPDDNTAIVWMKTSGFLETYTYHGLISSITSFGFLDPPVEANLEGNEISAELPPGTDPSHLIAVFTTDAGATVRVNNAIQSSGVTVNDFIAPVIYSVTSATGAVKSYRVSISITTSVEDKINNPSGIQLFPIPARNYLNVKIPGDLDGNTPVQLILYSSLGKILYTRDVIPGEEITLDTTPMGSGLFVLKINDQAFKIVIAQ